MNLIITALFYYYFLKYVVFYICVQIRNKKMQDSTEQTHLFTQLNKIPPSHVHPTNFPQSQPKYNMTVLIFRLDL